MWKETLLGGIGFLLIGLAGGVVFPQNLLLAVVLGAAGLGCLVYLGYLQRTAVKHLVGRLAGVIESEDVEGRNVIYIDKREVPASRESWEGLTDAELELIRRIAREMYYVLHGHHDMNAMIDEVRRGEGLTGPCTRCCVGRTKSNGYDWLKGEPDE